MKRITLLCLSGILLTISAETWAAKTAPNAGTHALPAAGTAAAPSAGTGAAAKHASPRKSPKLKKKHDSVASAPAASTKITVPAAVSKTSAPGVSTRGPVITGQLASDVGVVYLTAPALVYPSAKNKNGVIKRDKKDGTVMADTKKPEVCIPTGAPVHIWSADSADHVVLSLDADLTSGFVFGYTDKLTISDCLSGTALDSKILYVSLEKTVTFSPIAQAPTSIDKNGRTYKSGFLGQPLTVNKVDVNGKVTQVCLARGTRVSMWEDNNDLARATIDINDPTAKNCSHTATVQTSDTDTYYVATREIANSIEWQHFIGGILFVPFKYYIGGDRSFTGSATVAGYLGWQFHFSQPANELTVALFAGQSTISVPVQDASSSTGTTTNNVSGAALGVGLFASLDANPSIQYGIVLGRDYVSDSAHWINNHRGWVSVQLGYSFL
jgi:hypothetical protein